MSVTAPESPRLSGGYEVANALGRLNADRPKLGARCTEEVTIAKTLRYYLHALDLYAQATGRSSAQVAHDLAQGRIEVRKSGAVITVVSARPSAPVGMGR